MSSVAALVNNDNARGLVPPVYRSDGVVGGLPAHSLSSQVVPPFVTCRFSRRFTGCPSKRLLGFSLEVHRTLIAGLA